MLFCLLFAIGVPGVGGAGFWLAANVMEESVAAGLFIITCGALDSSVSRVNPIKNVAECGWLDLHFLFLGLSLSSHPLSLVSLAWPIAFHSHTMHTGLLWLAVGVAVFLLAKRVLYIYRHTTGEVWREKAVVWREKAVVRRERAVVRREKAVVCSSSILSSVFWDQRRAV
jgi:hypothetical protein